MRNTTRSKKSLWRQPKSYEMSSQEQLRKWTRKKKNQLLEEQSNLQQNKGRYNQHLEYFPFNPKIIQGYA